MDLENLQSEIDRLFAEMIDLQEKKVLEIARGVEPHVTRDDLWNICNHPGLEKDPYFQYEDGHLAGLMAARIAVAANLKERIREASRITGASSSNPNPAGRDPGHPTR